MSKLLCSCEKGEEIEELQQAFHHKRMGPLRVAAGSRQTAAALGILFTLLLAQGAQNLTSKNATLLAIPVAHREFLSLQTVVDRC